MYQPLTGKARLSVQMATARGNVWEGAVRAAKTVSSILKWLEYTRQGPPGRLLMVGKTERALKENVIIPIQEMVGESRCRYRAGAGELDLLGRTLAVVGASDERASDKIKGRTLAGAYCDEITTYPESFFQMLTTRFSVKGAQWFGTTNPASKNHWFYKNYVKRASTWVDQAGKIHRRTGDDMLSLHRFSFTLDDNPHLDAEYLADLKRMYTGLFFKRYILGEWVLAEGAVFDTFDPELGGQHVVDDLPRILRWISLGIDYGTTNPFHAVVLGLGDDGLLYVVRDWRYDSRKQHRKLTDVEYSSRLRAWLNGIEHPKTGGMKGVHPEWTVVDPSAASFVQQLYRDGLTPRLADNEVFNGIMTVSNLFALGLLKIHVSCVDLIDEIAGYAWDDEATEKGLDEPLKVDDHGPDAVRYGLHTTRSLWIPHVAWPREPEPVAA
jgi:PBSX family phage terminase large subunit